MTMKRSTCTAAITSTLLAVATVVWLAAQTGVAQESAPASSGSSAVPRLADGHPDFSGVWWRGADVGGRPAGGAKGGAKGAAKGGAKGPAPVTFASLYQPWAAEKAKTLGDKDDPTLRCVPTALGTFNLSIFDVGAVGQIVHTPKFMTILTETYHGFQLIPTDGRPHRDTVPPSYHGDAVAHWEGDTLVVDRTNFSDVNWMSAEGRVSFHSDALHIVERYRRPDANSLEIETLVEDPKVLKETWKPAKQTLQLAPFDQIMELACSGLETQGLMDAAAKQGSEKK
jgi:hypothetical protein